MCVRSIALPREGSGRVWRQEEVPASLQNLPQPTPRAAANIYLFTKKALDLV